MILDGFYSVISKLDTESGFEWRVQLNKDHFIYKAHFPNNPITPGVCMLQMCQEALSQHFGRDLRMLGAKNIKFLHVWSPLEYEMATFSFQLTETEGLIKVSVLVAEKEMSFAKFSLSYE